MSSEFDDAHKILRWRPVGIHLANFACLLSPYPRSNNYIFKFCQKKYSRVMPGVNCSVFDCGSCRRMKEIRIFMVPLAKDDAHKRWREEWLGKIKKTGEMDQDFWRQINDDKIYTCEKHFKPEDIEICKYRLMNSSRITCTLETSSQILKTILYEWWRSVVIIEVLKLSILCSKKA